MCLSVAARKIVPGYPFLRNNSMLLCWGVQPPNKHVQFSLCCCAGTSSHPANTYNFHFVAVLGRPATQQTRTVFTLLLCWDVQPPSKHVQFSLCCCAGTSSHPAKHVQFSLCCCAGTSSHPANTYSFHFVAVLGRPATQQTRTVFTLLLCWDVQPPSKHVQFLVWSLSGSVFVDTSWAGTAQSV